ncbi:MAG: hypothetical protein ABJA20_07320, partial [Novosphingobium sp.]
SLGVPALASTDFRTLAWMLTGFLVASGLIGYIWAPSNEGKSLEQLVPNASRLTELRSHQPNDKEQRCTRRNAKS